MAAVLVDRHIADFDVGGSVRPLTDVQHTDDIFSPQQCDLVLPRPYKFHLLFAMDGHVLLIAPRLEKHRVAFLRGVDRFLDRGKIPAPVEGDSNRARA